MDDFVVSTATGATATPTSTPTPANTLTPTATPVGPTSTPTSIPTPTPTSVNTPTPTPTSTGGGSNLLTNGGFETGDFTGWDLWDSGQSVVGTSAHSGTYRAKTTKGEVRQTFSTVAGQTYDVSAWIRINTQQQAATWGGIRVLVTDLNWNEVSSVVLTPATSPIGQWTRVQFSFVATTAQSHLHAGPFTDGLYTVSMDDFVVSTATGATATPTPTATPVGPTSTPTTTPASGLPAPWQYTGVGTVGAQGSAAYAGGVFTLSSASGDIWAQQDSFRFAYQSWSGDGTLVARIASLTATDGWAQAGLMFRESLNANARFGGIFATAQNGVQMLQRTSTGGSATDIWPNDGQGQPVWLKLVRQGSAIRGYKSSDGTTWTQIGSLTVAMNSTLYVGLAVTSQMLDTPATAGVDNVTLTTAVGTLGGSKVVANVQVSKPEGKRGVMAPKQATGEDACLSRGWPQNCRVVSYYYFAGQRVAMRSWNGADPIGVVTWLHSDHLGSASVATDAGGNKTSELRYKPFGEVRYGWGAMPTDRQFGGQLSVGMGIIDFGQGTRLDSYIEYSAGGGRMYDPLIGRFISPDPIVPRPGDPQALNRYSYARSNPTTRIDSNGHADDDPQRRELCKALPMLCSPASLPLANEAQMGESMSVQQAPVTTGDGAQVTFFAAKNGNDGKDKGKSGIGGLINALLRLLGLGGGGGAGKVAQELSKDGDPTNEVRNAANTFTEGFSKSEQQLMESLTKRLGLENKGITFWRGEGAPEAYRASASTDKPYITIFDGFFKLNRQQQMNALREEWNHLQQNIQSLSDDLIRYYENEAKRGR